MDKKCFLRKNRMLGGFMKIHDELCERVCFKFGMKYTGCGSEYGSYKSFENGRVLFLPTINFFWSGYGGVKYDYIQIRLICKVEHANTSQEELTIISDCFKFCIDFLVENGFKKIVL